MNAKPVTTTESTYGPDELAARAIQRRGVEAVIWGMPVVNYDLMYQAMVREAKGAFNQIAYWSRLPDWKIQTLTPNPDAIYLTPFTNSAEVGPVVLEIPPANEGSITGTIMDAWQCALKYTSPITKFFNVGLGGNGLFERRQQDEFGASYAYTDLSKVLKDNLDLLPLVGRRLLPEHQVELFYNFHITPWLRLSGDLQIIRPNRPIADTAIVPGMRLKIVF